MHAQEVIYKGAGFGNALPLGKSPAILVVDFSYGFTDTTYPTAADMSEQILRTRTLTDIARAKTIPVIYTTIAYQPWERDHLTWLKKASGMKDLLVGTRLTEIDARTGIEPTDPIVVKHGASAFFGTNLMSLFTSAAVDTVVVCGATTSGCVRATAVDAVQCGLSVLVPSDCVGDRAVAPHEASLYDINQKYANVVDCDSVLSWLEQL